MTPRGGHCRTDTSLMERWAYSAGCTGAVPSPYWLFGKNESLACRI